MTRRPSSGTCVLCKKTAGSDRLVFSKHTGRHYCMDTAACGRRVKRQERASRRSVTV